MAARLAAPSQGGVAGGNASPDPVRELIVIPEIPDSIHLQHAIQQVSSTVVEVNGGSSGDSSPSAEPQHTYITVAMQGAWSETANTHQVKIEEQSDHESEGSNGVNYHVQYVTEPQEIYTQGHQTHMDTLRSYPVYGVTTVPVGAEGAGGVAGGGGAGGADGSSPDAAWGGATAEYTTYGVVVAGDEAETASSPATPAAPRMPPATVQWLLDNYETAEGVSLPRSTLYAHYLRHCTSHRLDPVNAASFGKLIRSVFIGLRTRRLGTRGNSKYHYYGIRAKGNLNNSPSQDDDKTDVADQQEEHGSSPSRSCSPTPGGAGGAGGAGGVAAGVVGVAHRQYLGSVIAPDPPALVVHDLPDDISPTALVALNNHHREHGVEFLEAIAALDITAVERSRRSFWRRPPPELCRRVLFKLAARKDVAQWLKTTELELYQRAVELLLPDVLRPIPPQLTQAIRNFAKCLETALGTGGSGAPAVARRAQASAAAALAAALRRYTSLNHLAQAARAVLTNHHQIHQMLSDLNRVDFRVVREQAAWACACSTKDTAHRLEADFKATLGRGATLEQWAAWLEGCVKNALAPHEHRADYTARARRLLLDWSFYSSLVIRELTLRSAASFGSFHLIRLLYDEYVSYLIERQVAAHLARPPIAVMHTRQHDDSHEHQEDEEEVPEEAEAENEEEEEHEQEWEWDDDDEEDDDPVECKKSKLSD